MKMITIFQKFVKNGIQKIHYVKFWANIICDWIRNLDNFQDIIMLIHILDLQIIVLLLLQIMFIQKIVNQNNTQFIVHNS